MPWLTIATVVYVAGLAAPILYRGATALLQLRRERLDGHAEHRAHMEGFAAGAAFDERDRKEALRRRLRLE